MSDEKNPSPKRRVVLVDNHTHRGVAVPKGTVLDNVSDLTAEKFPKIFADESSPKGIAAIAAKKTADQKIEDDAAKAEADADASAIDAAKVTPPALPKN